MVKVEARRVEAQRNTTGASTYTPSTKASTGGDLYAYVKRFTKNGRRYEYFVVEAKENGKRRIILQVSVRKLVEIMAKGWCGGWASNPRRPTPTGLKPAPFGRARAPPHILWLEYFRVVVFLFLA